MIISIILSSMIFFIGGYYLGYRRCDREWWDVIKKAAVDTQNKEEHSNECKED